MEDQGLAATAGDCAPAGDQGGHSVIISGGVRQTCGHHPAAEEKRLKSDNTYTSTYKILPGEGEDGCELDQGEVIVLGAGVIGGVRQPGARGDGDLSVIRVSVVMLTHNNPDMEREFRNRLDNPHFEPDLNVDTSCSQWAAVRIVSSLIMVPPQNGERPPLNKSATCQGYSFWKA